MGGSIKVAVRFRDGSQVRQCRWTNNLPYYFNSRAFVEGDEDEVRKYLAQPSEYNDSEESALLAPEGYGIVILDYKTNKLISCQGYTVLGRIHLAGVLLEMEETDKWEGASHHVNLLAFASLGKIVSETENNAPVKNALNGVKTKQKLEAKLKTYQDEFSSRGLVFFNLDMAPLTIHDFNKQDMKQCHALVASLFELTPAEQKIWKREIKRWK